MGCKVRQLSVQEDRLVLLRRLVEADLMEWVAAIRLDPEVAYPGVDPEREQKQAGQFYLRVRELVLSELASLYRDLVCKDEPEAEQGSEEAEAEEGSD